MNEPSNQTERIAAALTRPGVEVRETHISWVFLTGDRAFKLRKAVVFPFLDYGTPERRRHMCEEELRLGKRFAPGLYLGLRAVVPDGDGFALADADRPDALEHVVEMRRFDEANTLAERLARGEVERDRRARARASHRGGPPGRGARAAGQLRARAGRGDRERELHHAARLRRGDRRPAARGRTPVRRCLPPRPARRVGGARRGRPRARVPRRPACRARAADRWEGRDLRSGRVRPGAAVDRRGRRPRLSGHGAGGGRARRPCGGSGGRVPRGRRRRRRRVAARLLRHLPGLGAREGGLPARGGAVRRASRAGGSWSMRAHSRSWRSGSPGGPDARSCS